ncbi:MAG: biotin--[acetyl-CoA-carboxylase] ligase [Gammaproteobacteria bacterium]
MESWVDLPGVDIHAFQTLPSTQDYLLPLARQQPIRPILCVADHQTQGRGRGTKTWHSPPGATLCFSLCLRMDKPLHVLGGITLAFGAALCEALKSMGAEGLGLKWPNDIYGAGGKLAGILTEVYAQPNGPTYVVVGVGVNLAVSAEHMEGLETAWTDLRTCTNGLVLNQKAALIALVKALISTSDVYEREGFAAFHALYDHFDSLKGKAIFIETGQKQFQANVLGVGESGELLIDRPPFSVLSGRIVRVGCA